MMVYRDISAHDQNEKGGGGGEVREHMRVNSWPTGQIYIHKDLSQLSNQSNENFQRKYIWSK